ncbi:hypothetical protein SB6408_00074 [Klebsiella spallanzanii]|uniref:Uncharacterized protein n=1 Tax=Klebsiella spallanzanii TaxID=2587528 RepID=A0A564H3D8_9ENTR|nr:hypothetical protein SB6408_00074 [Klebsiella spallanzanii]
MLQATTIMKALNTGESLPNSVSIMSMRLITMAAEEGLDTLNLGWRLGQSNPITTLLL